MASGETATIEQECSSPSIYKKDFEECCRLGGGGQGFVYKAIHKLSAKEFAVKKVCFKQSRENVLLREVKALSNLSHVNIVRYHHSWTEDGELSDEEEEESSEFSTEQTSTHDQLSKGNFQPKVQGPARILYIQMELCSSTLRQWIDLRNEALTDIKDLVYGKEIIMNIVRQVLLGVAHIHKEKLIHRDLKPENILRTANNVFKIGDFGLAKDEVVGENNTNEKPQRYGVGTRPYAAPEIVDCNVYDTKSDMYSVGVIMLEMCYPMYTFMEKDAVVKDLQKGKAPEALRTKGWKKQASALRQMVQKNAQKRPSAYDLVHGPLFLTQEQELELLREKVEKQDAQIKNLKEKRASTPVHSPAAHYRPAYGQAKVKRLNLALKRKENQVEILKLRLAGMLEEVATPDIELESPAMANSPFAMQFQNQREKDLFMRITRGAILSYRLFQRDFTLMLADEFQDFGFQNIYELYGNGGLKGMLEKALVMAQVMNNSDEQWDKIQERFTSRLEIISLIRLLEGSAHQAHTPAASGKKKKKKNKKEGAAVKSG